MNRNKTGLDESVSLLVHHIIQMVSPTPKVTWTDADGCPVVTYRFSKDEKPNQERLESVVRSALQSYALQAMSRAQEDVSGWVVKELAAAIDGAAPPITRETLASAVKTAMMIHGVKL